jgi:phosphate transport system protein
MRDDLDRQLDLLRHNVLAMGDQASTMLGDALQAFADRDQPAADRVIEADRALDRSYEQIQHGILAVIALHGPVGHDLRLLTAMIHVSLHLERMGDYAVNVARTVQDAVEFPADAALASQLSEMGALAGQVGREALRAFVQRDEGAAREAAALDDGVDRLNIGIFHRLVRLAADDEARLEWATRMIQLTRQLERYADHGVDIAEQTVFAVTGQLTELSDRTTG